MIGHAWMRRASERSATDWSAGVAVSCIAPAVGGLLLLAAATPASAHVPDGSVATLSACTVAPDPPEYYQFPLVTTKNVPRSGLARGVADVTYARSPFGVSVTPDGSYAYDVHVQVQNLGAPDRGVYTVWVTSSQVDQVRRVGVLDENLTASGKSEWNKFLVVITLEEADTPDATSWSGPIVLRGMSRSGMMHTMAGHGPFQQENCAAWGY